MSEQSISTFINARLQSLEEAINVYNKDKTNTLVRDAVILRLQRALSDVLALMHAAVTEEEECECESLEELLESLQEQDVIDENEEEALLDIMKAVEMVSGSTDDEEISEIMQYAPLYHKALTIFVKKFSFDEE